MVQVMRTSFNLKERSPKQIKHGFGQRYVIVQCYRGEVLLAHPFNDAGLRIRPVSDDVIEIGFPEAPQSAEIHVVLMG